MDALSVLTRPISSLGAATLRLYRTWASLLQFTFQALAVALSPSAYNSATRSVVHKQIYFTAWQILLPFTLFSTVLSFVLIRIVVSTASSYGLSDFALEVSLRLLVLEILPLVTVLFVALRSGAAINTEVALMRIQNEVEALEASGVDAMRLEFVPRVIGGTVSVLALVAVNTSVALVLAYLAVYGLQPYSLDAYGRTMAKVFDFVSITLLWLKTLLFGLAVTVIPISEGLRALKMLFFAPISVLRGMVRLFFVIMFIEVAVLTLQYI